MDFQRYELLQILHTQLKKRDMLVLLFLNKSIRMSVGVLIPTEYCLVSVLLIRWKLFVKDVIYQRKYRRSLSWQKKTRNEETQLLFF